MNCNTRKILAVALVLILVLSGHTSVYAEGDLPEVHTQALVLVDSNTGEVLYGKNEKQQMYPASTTKIMVALLALENLELDTVVTATNSALSLLPSGHTNIGIKGGEQLTVRQLLYALMLPSAGDAANVLGERISGSVDEFVSLMNKRAIELGMKDTNYMNTSGAHDDRHYTTAYDMGILAREVMRNDVFREIVATDVYIIPPTEKYPEERRLSNSNKLLQKSSQYYYQYATGIKTGFTNPAKLCLVSSAEKNGLELICVALGGETVEGKDTRFTDSKALFEYGFSKYKSSGVVKSGNIVADAPIRSAKGENKVLLEAQTDLSYSLKTEEELVVVKRSDKNEDKEYADNAIVVEWEYVVNENIKAPVSKGDVLGTAEYFINGESIGVVNLVATKDYAFDAAKNVLNVVGDILTSPFLYLPIVLAFLVLVIIRQYNYNLRKKRRIELRRQQMREEAEKRSAAMNKRDFVDDFLRK